MQVARCRMHTFHKPVQQRRDGWAKIWDSLLDMTDPASLRCFQPLSALRLGMSAAVTYLLRRASAEFQKRESSHIIEYVTRFVVY